MKSLFEKVKKRHKVSHLILQKLISQSHLFRLRHFAAQCLRSLISIQEESEKNTCQIEIVHNRYLDSSDDVKDERFGHGRPANIAQVG